MSLPPITQQKTSMSSSQSCEAQPSSQTQQSCEPNKPIVKYNGLYRYFPDLKNPASKSKVNVMIIHEINNKCQVDKSYKGYGLTHVKIGKGGVPGDSSTPYCVMCKQKFIRYVPIHKSG